MSERTHKLVDVQEAPPARAAKWRFVGRRILSLCAAYGFREVHPSALEPIEVADRLGLDCLPLPDKMALRADALASLGRLFAEEALPEAFSRWLLAGEIFDGQAEPPLRWRSWSAVGCALFGVASPAADAELLALLAGVAADLRMPEAELSVSTLGDVGDYNKYVEATRTLAQLGCAACSASPDPLRFLTCADEGCRALAETAPSLRDLVAPAAKKRLEFVLAAAQNLGLTVKDDPKLLLDGRRYQGTIFELSASGPLGRVAIARGGRRDHLVEALGGPATPMVGVTLGILRAASCTPGEEETFEPACEVFFASKTLAARSVAAKLAHEARGRGMRVDVELRDIPLDEQLARGERIRARLVAIVGGEDKVELRNLRTGAIEAVKLADLTTAMRRALR